MSRVLRILDANANRAREALRVMEEAARFVLDDASLAAPIKSLRHDLAAAMNRLPALDANRDTPGDVGATTRARRPLGRESVADVARAAGARLSEALRAIEEYAKVLPASADQRNLPAIAEALRYRGYDIEQRLNRALGAGRGRQWRLCVLISAALCPRGDWLRVARAAIAGGADCIQLREKSLDAGELLGRARALVAICRKHGVTSIINDRPDVALLSGADGVHVGQTDLPCAEVRRLVGRQLIVGVSTSRLAQARRALVDGADYCGVGPMFPTTTKHKDLIVGPSYLRRYLAWNRLPHLAIAGITPENLPELLRHGVRGVAVSSVICSSSDPVAVTRRLVRLLRQGERTR